MDNFYISAILREMEQAISGRTVARVFLVNSDLLIDLRLENNQLLFASLDRTNPALYLSGRQPGGEANASHPFAIQLRKHITGARLTTLSKDPLDRIVRLEFEKFDVSGDRARSQLVLAMTGRAANAYILNSEHNVVAALTDHAVFPESRTEKSANDFHINDSMTEADILETEFGPSSIFSPLIKNEFIARCRTSSPAQAFRSIAVDLFDKNPTPLVYSRLPIEQTGQRLINLKTDLLLSHIELVQAQGMLRSAFPTLSEAADRYYSARDEQKALQNEYNSARQLLAREIKKREAAMSAILRDRERFEDPERLKRHGDLLLANLATARVTGAKAKVIDYYDPDQAEIEIEIDENKTLQQSAAEYFSRYQKAKRALTAIAVRQEEIAKRLSPIKNILNELEADPTAEQISKARYSIEKALGTKRSSGSSSTRKTKDKNDPVLGRRFKTTDGYEVMVGRNDRDNDALTFRAARPQDIWLHAADYPGSHVVVRNPNREAVPHKTIVEAAELAAFYSQAKREGKAAVHYTQRKFVSKPPRAKPGLVRLSSFKTVMVEPRCVLERLG
ncbi:MAG TPA: NFACT family protein [Blastocatellia bacterium]|nr:NFACT family protein [Blastocatellia bacterium]